MRWTDPEHKRATAALVELLDHCGPRGLPVRTAHIVMQCTGPLTHDHAYHLLNRLEDLEEVLFSREFLLDERTVWHPIHAPADRVRPRLYVSGPTPTTEGS